MCAKITDIVSSIDFCPLCGIYVTHAFKLTMQTENVDNKHFSSCAHVVLSVASVASVAFSVAIIIAAVVVALPCGEVRCGEVR